MRLTFLLDQLVSPTPGGIGRYAFNLAEAVASLAPEGTDVSGSVAHPSTADAQAKLSELSSRMRITERKLSSRVYNRVWTTPTGLLKIPGRIHAPSLAAPIIRSTKSSYVVPTIHDTVPWSHPETLSPHGVAWHKRMAYLAWKFSPAIAVPTNAVANSLQELFNFGDRIHVIPGASSLSSVKIENARWNELRISHGIAEDFVLCVGTKEPRKGLHLLRELSTHENTYQVVHVGPSGWGETQNTEGSTARFHSLGFVSDEFLKLLYLNARSLVLPSVAEGFGLPVVEAMSLGCPVVISSDPALQEVSGGLARVVDVSGDPVDVSFTIKETLDGMGIRSLQPALESEKLIAQAGTFSWISSASKVWELHQRLG